MVSGGGDGEIRSIAAANDEFGESQPEVAEAAAARDRVNELFKAHLDLVDVIAKHVSRAIDGAVEFDELLAAGREGLFDAARRFDPKRGLPFRAFAGFRVEGAIIDGIRKSFRLPRRLYERLAIFEATCALSEGESAAAMRPSNSYAKSRPPEKELSDQLAIMATAALVARDRGVAADSAADERRCSNPEEAYADAELMALVKTAIGELGESEAAVIRLYYFEERSFESAAEAMEISKPWANRLHARGMEILTKRLRGVNDD